MATSTWRIEDLEPIDLDEEEEQEGEESEEPSGDDGADDSGENEDGEDDDSDEDGEDGTTGKGKGKKSSDKKGDDELSDDVIDKIDKHNKEIEDKLNDSKDLDKEELDKEEQKDSEAGKAKGRGGQGSTVDGPKQAFDYTKIKPSFSWSGLIKKMVSDVSKETDETYHKPNRKNITGLEIARQTGSAAVKPGEVVKDKDIKLVFIVDSSGSMTGIIDKIYSNIANLLKTHKVIATSDFYLIKYSGSHHIYKCNLGNNSYVQIASIGEKNVKLEKGNLGKLFAEHLGNATNFSPSLVSDIEKLVAQNYNALILTDSDILDSNNLSNLIKLFSVAKNKLNIITDSKQTYHDLLKKLGQVSRNVTYFD